MMKASDKSILLFLFGCIPARIALAYVAKEHTAWLPQLAVVALAIGAGFMYIFLTGSRKVGAETFGKPIWWNNLRPLHGFLYIAFAISAFAKSHDAWLFLAMDVIIGTMAFLIHHWE